MTVPQKTYKLDPYKEGREIGIYATRSGYITPDVDIEENFKYLHVGVAGDLVVRGIDFQPQPFLGVAAGSMIAVIGSMVLSSATIPGLGLINTTAGNITWHGGR